MVVVDWFHLLINEIFTLFTTDVDAPAARSTNSVAVLPAAAAAINAVLPCYSLGKRGSIATGVKNETSMHDGRQ